MYVHAMWVLLGVLAVLAVVGVPQSSEQKRTLTRIIRTQSSIDKDMNPLWGRELGDVDGARNAPPWCEITVIRLLQ